MNLLLIGAGQLGSRHLQSCLKLQYKLNIYVVDHSENSLALSEERANEIENSANHKLHYLTDLSLIDELSFEILIIATGASVRFEVLANVLKSFSIKYAILEKVLFQKLQDFTEATFLLEENKVTTFVNCPLRVYPFFKEIKKQYISAKGGTKLKYVGGEWIGLACNSIHYLDLMNFLTGEELSDISTEHLDDGFINSKRPGNIEFTGNLDASFSSGSKLTIEAIKGSEQNSTIEIASGVYQIVIEELTGKYCVFENGLLVEDSHYNILYQSDLTHRMIEQIEEFGLCDLIDFDGSVKLHQIFISKLLEHYNKFSDIETKTLPIT
ncbi:MAG: hypothetical protein COA74_00375 [Gammaproteobacteria bacterium]|nr:MAG: hypothetical protein COA74_00375 [Gammaproteobacteria bacterium]